MDNRIIREKRTVIWLIFSLLEGVIPVILYFQVRSMDRNAFLFGFSLSRLAIGGAFLLARLALTVFTLFFAYSKSWRSKVMGWIDAWLTDERLLVLFVRAAGIVFSGFLLFWWVGLETTIDLNTFEVIFGRLRWMISWGVAVSAQFLTLLVFNYRLTFKRKDFYQRSLIYPTILVVLMTDASLFHWIINQYEIQIFVSIPYWTWFFQRKAVDWKVIALLFGLSLAVVWWTLARPRKYWLNLALLILFGYVFQIGYGFAAGDGFESIRQKSIKASHVRYLEYAVDNLRLEDALFNYEEAFGWGDYLGTKPPGVLVFYILDQKASSLFQPKMNYAARFERLSRFNTYLFPWLTFSLLIITVGFGRKYLPKEYHFFPALLLLFLPNIILMPLEMDQVLFPMLFMLAMLLTYKTIQTQSPYWALATGLMIYINTYFSFSLLPVGPMAAFWVLLDYWVHRRERRFFDLVKLGAMMAAGFLIFYVFGYLVLNYDMIQRYQVSIGKHKQYKEFQSGIGQLFAAIRMNQLEIATWLGFPIAMLWGLRFYHAIKAFIQKKLRPLDVLTLAFLLMYILLNLVGQTRGEVARLWLFMTPLIVLFVTQEIIYFFRHRRALLTYLVVLQFITILMTYRCADFW